MSNANANAFSVGQLANIGGQLYVMMPANNAAELLQVQTLAAAAAQSNQPALVLANAIGNGDGGDDSMNNGHDGDGDADLGDRESDALSSSSSVVIPASPGSSSAAAAAANNHLSSGAAAAAGSANSSLNLGAGMSMSAGVGANAELKSPTPIIRDERRRATHNEVERRRRDKINNWITRIACLVPDCANEHKYGQSKGDVLAKAVTYLERVSAERESLQEVLGDLSRLIHQYSSLATQYDQVHRENALLRTHLANNGMILVSGSGTQSSSSSIISNSALSSDPKAPDKAIQLTPAVQSLLLQFHQQHGTGAHSVLVKSEPAVTSKVAIPRAGVATAGSSRASLSQFSSPTNNASSSGAGVGLVLGLSPSASASAAAGLNASLSAANASGSRPPSSTGRRVRASGGNAVAVVGTSAMSGLADVAALLSSTSGSRASNVFTVLPAPTATSLSVATVPKGVSAHSQVVQIPALLLGAAATNNSNSSSNSAPIAVSAANRAKGPQLALAAAGGGGGGGAAAPTGLKPAQRRGRTQASSGFAASTFKFEDIQPQSVLVGANPGAGAAFTAGGVSGLLNGNANNVHHLLQDGGASLLFDDAIGSGVNGEVEVGGGGGGAGIVLNGNSNGLVSAAMPPAKKRRVGDSNHVSASASASASAQRAEAVEVAENGDSGLGIGTEQNGTPTSQHSSHSAGGGSAASIALQLQLPGTYRPIPD